MNTVTREHLAGLELALEELALGMDMRKQVEKLIAQASAAPEQEPVAWMDSRSPGMHATISNEVKRHNTRLGGAATAAVTGYSIPLYTHPSAEIERLRAERDSRKREADNLWQANEQISQQLEAETQRADAAERKLGEVANVLQAVQEQFNRYGDRLPDGFDTRVFRWVDDAVAAQYASAEPASPKCTTCSDVGVIGHSTMCPDCNQPAEVKS